MKKHRPYRRCQECGEKFPGGRARPLCESCRDGQTFMFDTRPEGFVPVVEKRGVAEDPRERV